MSDRLNKMAITNHTPGQGLVLVKQALIVRAMEEAGIKGKGGKEVVKRSNTTTASKAGIDAADQVRLRQEASNATTLQLEDQRG